MKAIKMACNVLKKGGLVVIPSDTVYGLAADAMNNQAVEKLIEFKSRPKGKAISVFVDSLIQAEQLVLINKKQKKILESLLPGPFTVILPSKHVVSSQLESEKDNLGIRLPQFEFITQLVKQFGEPITATSANLSGDSPHYSIEGLLKSLSERKKELLDLIIDFGKLPRHQPSTIIDLTQEKLKILRQGDLHLKTVKTFVSKSEKETKKVARFLLTKYQKIINQKPLIFLIEGELGVGKTIFIKGIGEELGIENIVSPSFVVYYEYPHFFHLDLYKVEEEEELRYLGIEKMLIPKNIIGIEWGEKIGKIYQLLKKKGKVIYVKMKYIDEMKREIGISI